MKFIKKSYTVTDLKIQIKPIFEASLSSSRKTSHKIGIGILLDRYKYTLDKLLIEIKYPPEIEMR